MGDTHPNTFLTLVRKVGEGRQTVTSYVSPSRTSRVSFQISTCRNSYAPPGIHRHGVSYIPGELGCVGTYKKVHIGYSKIVNERLTL